jgi:hypothetical protein
VTEFIGTVDIKPKAPGSASHINLDGDTGKIGIYDGRSDYPIVRLNGIAGILGLGGHGTDGVLSISNSSNKVSMFMDGAAGDMNVNNIDGIRSFTLQGKKNFGSGDTSVLWVGGKAGEGPGPGSISGSIILRDSAGSDSIVLNGMSGGIYVRNFAGKDSIVLDGNSGDIILANADCAEDFDISHSTEIEPGTVMVIEQEGKLKECDLPYDKRVAGVISGAGNYKPGLVLDKRKSIENRKSISLMGKVYCKVDAQSSSINVGDLLTTSSTRGHAMKAADPMKAFGSVIGKALRPLKAGTGLIPILIALQ